MYEQEIYDAVTGIKPASDLRKRVVMNAGAYAERRCMIAGRSEKRRDSILSPHLDPVVYNPDYYKDSIAMITQSDVFGAELTMLAYSHGLL